MSFQLKNSGTMVNIIYSWSPGSFLIRRYWNIRDVSMAGMCDFIKELINFIM